MPRLNEDVKTEVKAKARPFDGVQVSDLKPYTTRQELPPAKVEYDEYVNEKGQKVVTPKLISCGEPRVYLQRTPKGWINVVGIWKDVNGTCTMLLRTLKPKLKDSADPGARRRGQEDAAIYEELRKKGASEEFGRSAS